MKLSRFIYYFCVGIYGGMMGILGYGITSLPFWIGLVLIITSNTCGMYGGRSKS